ncbi:MAG: helix-turn-helix domain-containing protein [Oscillospiraceae bacterium]
MLSEIMDWNSLGIEVAGMADTGRGALEMIIRTVPDIVIINAKLQDLSTPEVITLAKEQGVFAAYIIIYGTRSFEAVYSALKCGVEEYLVGPLNPKDLYGALRKICDRRLAEEIAHEKELRDRRLFEINRSVFRKYFINNLLTGNIKDAAFSIKRINNDFFFNFRQGVFEAAILRPDFRVGADISFEKIDRLTEELAQIVEEQLQKRCFELICYANMGEVICIFNYSGDIRKEYVILFEKLRKKIKQKYDGFLTIAVGSQEYTLGNIPISYERARIAVQYRISLGVDRIIPYGMYSFEHRSIDDIITPDTERRLRNATEALFSKAVSFELDELFASLSAEPNTYPPLYYNVSSRVAALMLDTLKEAGVLFGNRNIMYDEFNHQLYASYSPQSIRNCVVSWAVALIEHTLQGRDSQESRSIRIAKAYIKDHYMESIRLNDVALVVHLNPSYLSTLFKSEVGINFNDYLIDCRLTAAKQLLRDTTLTVNQIAEKIGYSDSKYFSKLFVKVVGVKPSEYRKLYS